MYLLPCLAKFGQVFLSFRSNALCLVLRETRLPQTQRVSRAIQDEDGVMPLPEDVNVCRPVIVGKNNDAQTPQSQHAWHVSRIS
jgi:hypothetical protein